MASSLGCPSSSCCHRKISFMASCRIRYYLSPCHGVVNSSRLLSEPCIFMNCVVKNDSRTLRKRRLCLTNAARQTTSGEAPALRDVPSAEPPKRFPPSPPPSPLSSGPSAVKVLYKRVLKRLSSLELAIAELATIGVLSGLGTVLEQGQSLEWYQRNYPDGPHKVLGFLSWQVFLALQLDHIYTANYFLALMALLGASLVACTLTRQWPAVRVARRWSFPRSISVLEKQPEAHTVPDADLGDLALLLRGRGYQVFRKGSGLYAFKGLVGKLGPIGVHASLVALLVGVAYGGLCGLKGNIELTEGSATLVASELKPNSPLAFYPKGTRTVMAVDDFRINYRDDGSVYQFYSDLTLEDLDGKAVYQQTISVNHPLRYGGLTVYQTDWALAGVQVQVRAVGDPSAPERVYRLPMAEVGRLFGIPGKTWGTFLPLAEPAADGSPPKGISMLAQDFQTVTVYDSSGAFAGVRRPGSGKPLLVDGLEVVVQQLLGSTGMEAKSDPGVPIVYAGFGGLMLTTVVSCLSHAQLWALQAGRDVHLGGRSNRDKLAFADELKTVMSQMPELPPPAAEAVSVKGVETRQ